VLGHVAPAHNLDQPQNMKRKSCAKYFFIFGIIMCGTFAITLLDTYLADLRAYSLQRFTLSGFFLLGFTFITEVLFSCFCLSVPVQLIAWKDSFPKWPILCWVAPLTLFTHSLTWYLSWWPFEKRKRSCGTVHVSSSHGERLPCTTVPNVVTVLSFLPCDCM